MINEDDRTALEWAKSFIAKWLMPEAKPAEEALERLLAAKPTRPIQCARLMWGDDMSSPATYCTRFKGHDGGCDPDANDIGKNRPQVEKGELRVALLEAALFIAEEADNCKEGPRKAPLTSEARRFRHLAFKETFVEYLDALIDGTLKQHGIWNESALEMMVTQLVGLRAVATGKEGSIQKTMMRYTGFADRHAPGSREMLSMRLIKERRAHELAPLLGLFVKEERGA